jgi:predicted metal-dependent hydrolase
MPVRLKTISFLSRSDPVVTVGEEVLPVRITVRPAARRMVLRVDGVARAVTLTLPRGVPSAEGLRFVRSRTAWIATRLAATPAPVPFAPGEIIAWRGDPVALRHDATARGMVFAEDAIVVGGPADCFAGRLSRGLKAAARRLLADDLAHYAARAGLAHLPRLAITDTRGRWGSASPRGGIRLSWRLAMAPDAVRRSVVAHEVAHLRHMHHGPAFYAWLDTLFEGDRRAADRWLKAHGAGLMGVGR